MPVEVEGSRVVLCLIAASQRQNASLIIAFLSQNYSRARDDYPAAAFRAGNQPTKTVEKAAGANGESSILQL